MLACHGVTLSDVCYDNATVPPSCEKEYHGFDEVVARRLKEDTNGLKFGHMKQKQKAHYISNVETIGRSRRKSRLTGAVENYSIDV